MTFLRLNARLTRLEALSKLAGSHPPAIIVGIDSTDNREIVGAGILGKMLDRECGESIESLAKRAGQHFRMRVLFAFYSDGSEAG